MTSSIRKKDFIQTVAEAASLTPEAVGKVLAATAKVAADELRTGGRVRVPGLATLMAKEYGARPGRNPKTGVEYEVPATVRLRAKPATALEKEYSREIPAAG